MKIIQYIFRILMLCAGVPALCSFIHAYAHSSNTVQHCGVYGDLCPAPYKQGYGTGTQHVCQAKVYN
jgi:hypothetical protein